MLVWMKKSPRNKGACELDRMNLIDMDALFSPRPTEAAVKRLVVD